MNERLIISGFGGQGKVVAGKLLAELMMHEGHHVTYFPSYGAEVRGGTCNCSVIAADGEIASPIIDEATSLILMNQPSVARFAPCLASDGLAVINASMAHAGDALTGRTVLELPATDMATGLGEPRVANIIMLGVYCAARDLFASGEIERHIATTLGESKAHLLDINLNALQLGREWFQKECSSRP